MRQKRRIASGDMRTEYDFDYTKAIRGKYHRRLLEEGAYVVVLDPDVARTFRTSAQVNEALRTLLEISDSTRRVTARASRRTTGARH